MRWVLFLFFILSSILLLLQGAIPQIRAEAVDQYVTGIVYNDINSNGTRDRREPGIPGICVSNGLDVVQTDKMGGYTLPVDDDTIIFVIKPTDWKLPVDSNNLPQFYYIHKPGGSPKSKYLGVAPTGPLPASVDFPLYKDEEPRKYKALFFGDPQPRDQKEVDYLAHDIVEELIGTDAEFGVTLGDIVFDDLSVFDSINPVIGKIGIPWHNVIGNHDTNHDSPDDEHSTETFQRYYGPPYYAFNYGGVHFIAIDDIAWTGKGYHGEIDTRQLDFIRNDLQFVPNDTLLVLMMHIPLGTAMNRARLFDLIDGYPHTFSISAHWHQQRHIFFGGLSGWNGQGKHHHLVNGTTCGCWWGGAPDEYGIPHATMADGTPNGYSIITFDGNEYSIEWKVARRPLSYQMNIFTPESVASSDAADTSVIVNVFAGSEKSDVEMKFGDDGDWVEMQRAEIPDPYILAIKQAEASDRPPRGRKIPNAAASGHIWRANLPPLPEPGTYIIHIRTTDMFGHTYEDSRLIRITP